jgi:capsule polysaccharide export protein KpsE/RkpR
MQTRPTLPQSDAPTQALGFPKLRLLWANTADVNYSQAIRCDVEVDASGDKIRRNLAVQELTGGFGSMAGDLLGVSSKGALVVALMRSRTVEDRMVDKFNLKKVYRVGLQQKARTRLEVKTSFSLDAKNGIVVLSVTDSDPRRAAAIIRAYVEELNTLMAQLNNSSAHRERVFLQDQLQTVTVDMETAEKQLSEFASKNAAMSINEQVRVMIESTAKLQGQLIAAESQLQEVREIYRDSSPQVRSLQARIGELVHQQKKLM